MSEGTAYKDTINLPQTEFPMKANLPQKEPEMIKAWEAQNLYGEILKKNSGRPVFSMPDGPPYANGDIHLGHVLNKTLKDFVIKYKNMAGAQAAFIPGWDCHGLPIEHKVTKDLGPKRKEKTEDDIRALCREEANKWVNRQREQFVRLGILADWKNPYLTMDPSYEAQEVRVLADILKNGVLYRGEKPVYWCPTLQTALAEAEVEYANHKSPSIYVKFYVEDSGTLKKLGASGKKVAFVIWTTTPWTLPANLAISVHPEFDYGLYESGSELWMVAKGLQEAFEKETGVTLKLVSEFKGSDLEGLKSRHPFMNRDSGIILGDHVTLEAGTGQVHTAPGHGLDDYQVGLKYGLPILSPVDGEGRYTSEVPDYVGMKIWDANPVIVERLKTSGHLLAFKEIEHSYPHNWRSKTPLIFRATPQWFIRMDDEKFNIRQKAISLTKEKIRFVPDWGIQRLLGMLENRPDWCLSRQRAWGVPIPVFYCKKCEEPLISSELMNRVADKMEKSGGIQAYFTAAPGEFTHDQKCKKCGAVEFTQGKDILDVWFDSGICWSAVQKKRAGLKFPADIYLEGSDQHRGWFQTSLLASIAATGTTPFDSLVTHGFVMDAKGRKMSKSLGNVIDPLEVMKKSGAEILRLWVAYEDYGQDVNVGTEMFDRITETYRRFRNTMKFLLGNLGDFSIETDAVPYEKMPALDQWALGELSELTRKMGKAYDEYEFHKVYHGLNQFFTVTLSATYLDILKDRLYTGKKTGLKRRSAQTVLWHMTKSLAQMMAPVASFLAEETYQYFPEKNKAKSIFLTDFPRPNSQWEKADLKADFAEMLKLRSEVSKSLEGLRQAKTIGASLEAAVDIKAPAALFQILKKYESANANFLCELFIVSKVTLTSSLSANSSVETHIQTAKADGEKCVRCWYISTEIGRSTEHPALCPKCVEAMI